MDSPEYSVEIDASASKEFNALDKADQKKAARILKELESGGTLRAGRVKYVDKPLWRRRVGDVRVVFYFDAKRRYIKVLAVRRRDDDTYTDLNNLSSKV